jgi:hypothetical protein
MTSQPEATIGQRYDKACEVWCLLHSAEQLIINDNAFDPKVLSYLNKCIDMIETLQSNYEQHF